MIPELTLSLALDVLIIVLLIATIIYAARLSLHLKKFRNARAEMDDVVKDLSRQINKADKAVNGLNTTVTNSSEELQLKMDNAKAMFDELDMVVQSGDALANRLEELAVRNRKILDGEEGDLADLAKSKKNRGGDDYDLRVNKIIKSAEETEEPSGNPFSIRDYDVDRGDPSENSGLTLDDNDMLSDAERDLYNALQNKKQRKGG
jgi:uncharacterized protein YhaN